VGASKLLITEKDVDIDEVVEGNPTQMAETARQYAVKLAEFASFCESDWDAESGTLPPSDLFTDVRLAKYFSALLSQFGPANSRRKTTLAALNDAMVKLGIKNIFSAEHDYPKLMTVLKVSLFVFWIADDQLWLRCYF